MKSLTAIMSEFTGKFQEYLTTIDPQTVESEEALYEEAGAMLMEAVKNAEPSPRRASACSRTRRTMRTLGPPPIARSSRFSRP